MSKLMSELFTIGLDLHSASFTLACLNEKGKLVKRIEMPTSEKNLREAVNKFPKPRVLVVEESHMAQWGKETLENEVDQLIVCCPKRNKWISHDDHVDDNAAALRLAKLMQGGNIKVIAHPDSNGAKLRALFLHYYDMTQHQAALKMRVKSIFRSVALLKQKDEADVYDLDAKEHWLSKLEQWPHVKFKAKAWYEQMELAMQAQQAAFVELKGLIKAHPAFERLQTIPGVGPISASAYVCLIGEARRFSRKNKLWAYAGLGNKKHDSGGKTYQNTPSKNGCRPLKAAVFRQFKAAVRQSVKTDNRFKRQYVNMTTKGIAWRAARRQICRSMLSVVRAMILEGGEYNDTHKSVQKMHKGMK